MLNNILADRRTTLFLILSWFLLILFNWWFIHPRVDDGIYLIPAINTLHTNIPGVNFSDLVEPVFFIFPTQPFFHGIFLKVLSLLNVGISIDTYRIFNYLLTILLLFSTRRLFFVIFDNNEKQRISSNLAMILLLGFSQFSMQFFVNRPEVFGLLFLILGLKKMIEVLKYSENSKLNISLACFYFGISTISHPNFALLSSFLLVYFLYTIFQKFGFRFYKYTITFFVPIALFMIWFFINYNTAKDQFFNRAQEVATTSFPAIVNIFSILQGDSNLSIIHNVYLQLHMATLVIILLFLVFINLKYSPKNSNDISVIRTFKVLSFSIFFLLLIMQPYRPNYLLISFLSVITASFFLSTYILHVSSNKEGLHLPNIKKKLIYVSIIFLALSSPMVHMAKIYISNGNYSNHHKTIDELGYVYNEEQHIFLTTAQLLPLFAKNISNDIKNIAISDGQKVHWYFPVADTPGQIFKELIYKDIENDVILMNQSIWGALKKTVKFYSNQSIACLSLKGIDMYVNLHNPKILFNDKYNIFLTSAKASVSNKCIRGNESSN